MKLILYKNTSEMIRLNKTLIKLKEVSNAHLLENTTVTHPTIVMTLQNPGVGNYLYIEELGRYYYIKEVEVINAKQSKVYCEVDVLMSFRTQILNTSQHVIRNQYRYNMYINDSQIPILNKISRQTLYFNAPSSGWRIESDYNTSTSKFYYVLNCI